MSKLISINPFTEEVNATFESISREELDIKIARAHSAYLDWRKSSSKKALMLRFAEVLEEHQEECARLQTQEMGMLYSASFAGITNTVALTRWFAENFESILAPVSEEANGTKHQYQYDPLGVIFGIAPWNFPFNQVLRAAIPNILAGNTVLYKHASNTPLAGKKIEELFLLAGFPEGVYQNIMVSSSESEYILSRKEIRGVNLTGSEGAGRAIGSLAGKYLKPSVLELGGNDAFIVMPSSDLRLVAKAAVQARISNNGQRCNASKRFIIPDAYYDTFAEYFVQISRELRVGDPFESTTELGPLARIDLLHEIEDQVNRSISEGAKLLTGGKRIGEKGCLFEPTVLGEVTSEMTSFREEIFGPVASLVRVKDINEAIELANASDFGLCGCVFGDDVEAAIEVAKQIETGMVFINRPAASQAHLPFGGVKLSGYGKENGAEGLRAFTNKKVIVR